MSNDRSAVSLDVLYGSGGTISYTGSAANSSNLPQGITGVWVTCSTDAWAKVAAVAAAAPAATTADFFCAAGQTYWIPNSSATGQPVQLSVIRDAVSGSARFVCGL